MKLLLYQARLAVAPGRDGSVLGGGGRLGGVLRAEDALEEGTGGQCLYDVLTGGGGPS